MVAPTETDTLNCPSRTGSTPTTRLLGSLLPRDWNDRDAILESAARLDEQHDGDGSGILLRAWARWRATGEVPAHPLVRDALQALGQLLGGIASEMRYRPRVQVTP